MQELTKKGDALLLKLVREMNLLPQIVTKFSVTIEGQEFTWIRPFGKCWSPG